MPTLRSVVNVLYLLNHLYSWYYLSLGKCLLHNGWLLRERPNVGLSRSLPDPESVCTDTSILLFGNVLNAYLNNHNIILLNIDGCEYCISRYLFVCILTWVLIKSSVCLYVCLNCMTSIMLTHVWTISCRLQRHGMTTCTP